MNEDDKWITEYDSITINDKKYWFRIVGSFERKAPNDSNPSRQLVINVYKEGEGWINWEEFKHSYFAEKLTDYIQNTLNGQRAVYWNRNEKRSF